MFIPSESESVKRCEYRKRWHKHRCESYFIRKSLCEFSHNKPSIDTKKNAPGHANIYSRRENKHWGLSCKHTHTYRSVVSHTGDRYKFNICLMNCCKEKVKFISTPCGLIDFAVCNSLSSPDAYPVMKCEHNMNKIWTGTERLQKYHFSLFDVMVFRDKYTRR